MALFRRGRKPAPRTPEATEAERRLGMGGWATIHETRRDNREWRALVAEVGPDLAIEHTEVWVLMTMVASAEKVVADRLQGWRTGADLRDQLLMSLLRLAQNFRGKTTLQIESVVEASTRPESVAVSDATAIYGLLLFKTAMDRIEGYDNVETQSAAKGFIVAKENWRTAVDAWDTATDRQSLPLVSSTFE